MTATEQQPGTAVAHVGAAEIVESYRADYAQVLPSHIRPETWTRLAVGALRRDPKLRAAAERDPGSLLVALLDAARKGLEPGTEQYYLVPWRSKNGPTVQGIEGYQGIVERMYRAGAVSSVIVEVVRERDSFRFVPGRDTRPIHEIDWFGGARGPLVGVYAYAVMRGGATSKVVVLNREQVMAAKARNPFASDRSSPWTTDEEAMWLKTGARRLSKWVPLSSEYLREQLRAVRDVAAEHQPAGPLGSAPPLAPDTDDDVIDAEALPDPADGDDPWAGKP